MGRILLTAIAFLFCVEATAQTTPTYPALVLSPTTFFSVKTNYLANKFVFAQYKLTFAAFANDPNMASAQAGATQEVLMAQSMGLDGFVLDLDFSGDMSAQAANASALFAAAQALGTGFKLFYSFDFPTLGAENMPSGTDATIISTITSAVNSPNYFMYNSKAVFSTVSGGDQSTNSINFWHNQVITPLANQSIPTFFIPFFYPALNTSGSTNILPATADIQSNVSYWSSHVDGLAALTTQGLTYGAKPNVLSVVSDYNTALNLAGIPFMAGFAPAFWAAYDSSSTRGFYNNQGGIGIEAQWTNVIATSAPWVELMSWNDIQGSYIMPIDDFTKYSPNPSCILVPSGSGAGRCVPTGWFQDHRGLAEFMRYYVQWFKTGTKPIITKSAVFYFYAPQASQSFSLDDPNGQPSAYGLCADNLYLTTAMKTPASLSWSSGDSGNQINVSIGITHIIAPSRLGSQAMTMSRSGTALGTLNGINIVNSLSTSNYDWYDYWLATGYLETSP